MQVTFEVTNTGKATGDEIVQMYVLVSGKIQKPIKQLAGFSRITLRAGETRPVTLSLPHDHIALRFWDETKKEFGYEAGEVELMVGSSSADIFLHGRFTLV